MLEESSTYQLIVSRSKLQEARAILLRLGRRKFGEPDPAVNAAIESITDLARLEGLIDRLSDVTSWQELLAGLPS